MSEVQYRNDSLLITKELCQERKACKEGLIFLERYYPNGFTVDDIYNKRIKHIPMSFVTWGYHFLPLTESDKKKFFEYAQIENSGFFQSHHIKNCKRISYSDHCYDSEDINYSKDVSGSFYINHCVDIQDSFEVQRSTTVNNSTKIYSSIKVMSSNSVANSNTVSFSSGVFNSSDIHNCFMIDFSKECENCMFSKCLNDCKNKIFCSEMRDNDVPMIFDKEVSQRVFDRVFKELSKLLNEYKIIMTNEKQISTCTSILPSLVIWEKTLNHHEFWEAVKDIVPFFEEDAAYQLTLCSSIKI